MKAYCLNTLLLVFVFTIFGQAQHHNKVVIASGFAHISDMYVSPSGLVYLTDSQRHYLYRIDPISSIIDSVGGKGQSATQFFNPNGVDATNDLKIYVLDGGNGRIQMLDRRFQVLGSISIDFQHGEENTSTGILVNAQNEIRFWDAINRQLRGYTSTFFLDQQFRPHVRSVKQPIRRVRPLPGGFAIIDFNGQYIHRYNQSGRYLGFWTNLGSVIDIAHNSDHVIVVTEDTIHILSPNGQIERSIPHHVIGVKHIGLRHDSVIVATDTALYRVVY